jgi:hypothetical protein
MNKLLDPSLKQREHKEKYSNDTITNTFKKLTIKEQIETSKTPTNTPDVEYYTKNTKVS